jgi:PII-like signaling protein
MKPVSEAKRLRIYVSSTDKFEHSPLYEVIVYAAKRFGLTGATVFKGIMGYGASSEIHENKLWELSEKMPVIIEIVDDPEKIDGFSETIRPYFDKIEKGYLITIENTTILMQKTGERK